MSCDAVRAELTGLLEEPGAPLPADLQAHLESCPGCRQELAEMRETWAMLGRIEEEPSSDRMRARFHEMLAGELARLEADRRPAPADAESARLEADRRPAAPSAPASANVVWWPRRPALQAALLAAAVVAGVLVGVSMGSRRSGGGEIEALRAEMRSMTHAVTLSLLQHQSASERLRGVGLCETTPPDDELVQALLRVVDDDPSANVRLAALEVLGSLPGRPDVRDGLIASFPRQASAPVRAAMASLLLELDGQKAVDAVRAASTDEELPGTVRQYLMKILAEKAKRTGMGT
jgi:hypothetical protein